MSLPVAEKVIAGGVPTVEDIESALAGDPHRLFYAAFAVKKHFSGDRVDLCAILNAKSGACPEDCAYCAQSARHSADVSVYPLLDEAVILEKARMAREGGVKRFCIVTSGRSVSESELKRIAHAVEKIRGMGLLPCATLGLLDRDALLQLKDAGLERYHHNLETSERFFPRICSTHSYRDKMRTIEAVKEAGLSLCSGGIFGVGETWQDRLDMAFALRDAGADSVPINFLTPVRGTPLADMPLVEPLDALRIISIYRLILPERQIRVCGGRLQTLGELNPLVFSAGADGLLVGNYLTTLGRDIETDVRLIRALGFRTD